MKKEINFTDLILLVGTNPLPNLVVAKFFIKENWKLKRVWFVYSTDTSHYKDQIQKSIREYEKTLANRSEINFEDIQLSDVRNSKVIKREIKEQIIDKIDKNIKIHLNYTGGTKAMVIHSYRTLENAFKEKISFSYLDSEKFKIFDDEDGYISDDLRDSIKVTFDEMIKLHNYEKSKKEDVKDIINNSIPVIEEIFLNEDKFKEFFFSENNSGYDRKMFENQKEKGKLAEKLNELKKELFEKFSPNDILKKTLNSFPEEYKLFDENWKLKDTIDNKKIKFLIGFLDGKMLEYYIYKALEEVLDINEKNEFLLSSQVYKEEKGNQDIEIDLTFIKGYQLYSISCTTSPDKYVAKSKGFEIIHRSKQLGGEEAKSILITTLDNDNKEKLQETLNTSTGTQKENFLVLGLDDLKKEKLQEKVSEFIKKD